jgi:hypothetical protein
MKLDGEHERTLERFRSLRSEDELTAPSFDRMWREAVSRSAEPATAPPLTHALRFAVAILLLCVAVAGFTAMLLTAESRTAEEAPPAPPVLRPVPAPEARPAVQTVDKSDEPRKPEPVRRPSAKPDEGLDGKCASCPPIRKPKAPKSDRRQKNEAVNEAVPESNSCADC